MKSALTRFFMFTILLDCLGVNSETGSGEVTETAAIGIVGVGIGKGKAPEGTHLDAAAPQDLTLVSGSIFNPVG